VSKFQIEIIGAVFGAMFGAGIIWVISKLLASPTPGVTIFFIGMCAFSGFKALSE